VPGRPRRNPWLAPWCPEGPGVSRHCREQDTGERKTAHEAAGLRDGGAWLI
jgi:hypothetical protein